MDMSTGLKISELKGGTIYRSRLSGLPVLVYATWVQPEYIVHTRDEGTVKIGPFDCASVRFYEPSKGQYLTENGVHDYELEPMQ